MVNAQDSEVQQVVENVITSDEVANITAAVVEVSQESNEHSATPTIGSIAEDTKDLVLNASESLNTKFNISGNVDSALNSLKTSTQTWLHSSPNEPEPDMVKLVKYSLYSMLGGYGVKKCIRLIKYSIFPLGIVAGLGGIAAYTGRLDVEGLRRDLGQAFAKEGQDIKEQGEEIFEKVKKARPSYASIAVGLPSFLFGWMCLGELI